MEPLGLALSVPGLLQQTYACCSDLTTRLQDCSTNRKSILECIASSEKLLSALRVLEEALPTAEEQGAQLITDYVEEFKGTRSVLESVKQELDALQKKEEKLKWVKRFCIAGSMKEELEELGRRLHNEEQKLSRFRGHFVSTYFALQCQQGQVRASRGLVRADLRVLSNVPAIQSWLIMDFESRTCDGEPVSVEAQISFELLKGIRGKCSPSYHNTVLEVIGEMDTGVSVALCALVQNEDIAKQFLDDTCGGGIHLFELEYSMSIINVIGMLSSTVRKTGGWEIADAILAAVDHLHPYPHQVASAIELAQGWFKERNCLFIFNVRTSPRALPRSLLTIMNSFANLSKCSSKSAVVFGSGKGVHRSIGSTVRLVTRRTWASLRKKFLQIAEIVEVDSNRPEFEEYVKKIFVICDKRLVALSPAGNCVRLLIETYDISATDALIEFVSRFERIYKWLKHNQNEVDIQVHQVIMYMVVRVLEERAERNGEPWFLKNLSYYFGSFGALSCGKRLKYTWLQQYWSLSSEEEVQHICYHLHNFGHFGSNEGKYGSSDSSCYFQVRNIDIGRSSFVAELRNDTYIWLTRRMELL